MMADNQFDIGSSSKWQSIRPWNPRLSLYVREITSVSATFVVTSLSNSPTNLSLLLDRDASDGDDLASTRITRSSTVPTALAKGLSVKVNGTPWQRVLARIDDAAEEAVLIIYGLMPGRQYDIEIGVIAGEARVQGQLITEGISRDRTKSDVSSNRDVPEVNIFSTSQSLAVDPSPSPPSPSPPATPTTPTHSHQTLEEYFALLKVTLAHLEAEHETLSTTLKSARRDSQKSQAALRSEISSLKRASQKHSGGDSRMRQKVRALEEAVKQAVKGREDVEAEYEVVEAERNQQESGMAEKERKRDEVRGEAEEGRRRREQAEEKAAGILQGVKAELATVEGKLEKLRAKREKLDGRTSSEEEYDVASHAGDDGDRGAIVGGIVGELEAKLREMQMERERIEADPLGYLVATSSHDSEDGLRDGPSLGDSSELPPRFQTSGNAQHPRSHFHHQHHSFSPHYPRGKRQAPFSPPHAIHLHSQSHAHTYAAHTRNALPSTPPNSVPVRPPASVLRGSPHHFSARASQSHSAPAAGAARVSISRRASSPPPLAERSTLSSLAPPFEPASVRGKGASRSAMANSER